MPDTILTISQLRALEQQHADAHPPLMARAGVAAADLLNRLLRSPGKRVALIAGPGNNGGDARAMLAGLNAAGQTVTVFDSRQPPTPDMPIQWDALVDGLYGIGLTRAPEGAAADWIGWFNAAQAPIKLALDVPSGLMADTGLAYEPCIRATHTLSFLGLKPGLLMGQGPDQAGMIRCVDLGVPLKAAGAGTAIDASVLIPVQQPRARDSHKGCFGHVGVVGGAEGMEGAAVLCADAALHMGPGKVSAAVLSPVQGAAWLRPEIMWRSQVSMRSAGITTWVAGPGMGTGDAARAWLAEILRAQAPVVLDADALNLLAQDAALHRMAAERSGLTVLTPHPAEAARLLGLSTSEVQGDRLGAAHTLAARLRAWVVLKGCGTIVCSPGGQWWINTSGSPALATGGTGDVLAGLIAGLLAAQADASSTLTAAVWLHGAAAQALGLRTGLKASELAPAARQLLHG